MAGDTGRDGISLPMKQSLRKLPQADCRNDHVILDHLILLGKISLLL
jgi:hypothetical protein